MPTPGRVGWDAEGRAKTSAMSRYVSADSLAICCTDPVGARFDDWSI